MDKLHRSNGSYLSLNYPAWEPGYSFSQGLHNFANIGFESPAKFADAHPFKYAQGYSADIYAVPQSGIKISMIDPGNYHVYVTKDKKYIGWDPFKFNVGGYAKTYHKGLKFKLPNYEPYGGRPIAIGWNIQRGTSSYKSGGKLNYTKYFK